MLKQSLEILVNVVIWLHNDLKTLSYDQMKPKNSEVELKPLGYTDTCEFRMLLILKKS